MGLLSNLKESIIIVLEYVTDRDRSQPSPRDDFRNKRTLIGAFLDLEFARTVALVVSLLEGERLQCSEFELLKRHWRHD